MSMPPDCSRAGPVSGLGVTTLTLVLLAGCAVHAPPKADEARVKQFAGQGYLTDDQYGITTTFARWEIGNRSFDIAVTVPTRPGPFPLVIYLPALGESRSSGSAWRTAWAQGGYAVLVIQLLPDDATAWRSMQARADDVASLARERYASKAMSERVDALRTVLEELMRRQNAKEGPLERVDLSRVAVAGCDLGAYTAMTLAGEKLRGLAVPALPLSISAVVALSPYADFSGEPFSERYAGIHGPVLSVTSDKDIDPFGLVTSPSVRKAPFKYMDSGEKYLLSLKNVSYRTLAGGEIAATAEDGRAAEMDRPSMAPPEGGRGDRRHSRDARFGGGAGRRGAASEQLAPTVQALGVAAVQGVTTAFLDAYVKDDPIAREWLEKDATRWLRGRGEIERK